MPSQGKPILLALERALHASPSATLDTAYATLSYLELASVERIVAGGGLTNCCISCVVMISLLFDLSNGGPSSLGSTSSPTCHQ